MRNKAQTNATTRRHALLLLASLTTLAVHSQTARTITGTVSDDNGEPVVGATVSQNGANTRAVTDINGRYTLQAVGDKPTITFSYVGCQTLTVNADDKPTLNVQLTTDTQSIGEVVVTALGIKREKKMLGYAVQEVRSDQLNTTGDHNITSALEGKVAGMHINTASTGLSGSVKITLRGNSSLTDNNQPLWVVDGVPFTDNQASSASAYGGFDRGGTALDINPEDIETISVLKGANAAALYGARAGNGVIYITTKKGKQRQGYGINYSGSYNWSHAAYTLPMQNVYGQGSQGQIVYATADDGSQRLSSELAFGPLLDGHQEPSWTGQHLPFQSSGNHLKDYFRTASTQMHNVAVSNATQTSHFRTSLGYNDNRGLFHDEQLSKLNVDMTAGTTINSRLVIDGKISLSRMKAENRPLLGLNGEVAQLLLMPQNVRLLDLQNYQTNERMHQNWFGPDMQYANPYYIRHQHQNSDERWRAFGYYNAALDLSPWLNIAAKYAFDYYRTRLQATDLSLGNTAVSTVDRPWQQMVTEDTMQRDEENCFEQNLQLLFSGSLQPAPAWRLDYTLGGNVMFQKRELLGASVRNMLEKDNWIFNTAERLVGADNSGHERSMYSLLGSAQIAYSEWLALDLTARNDWSSTLPAHNRSFFYPSASLSFIATDFMRQSGHTLPAWLTFAKLRLSAAQVGKDPEPYSLYNVRSFTFNNGTRTQVSSQIKMNSSLKPEIKTSYEAGLDMKFLQNRLGFDFTFYHATTRNQAMLVSAAAPWTQQWVNAGRIVNSGLELTLYTTPVKTRSLTFDLNVNLAKNTSHVKQLAQGTSHVYFAGDTNMPVKVGATEGGQLGDIYANNLLRRTTDGQLIIGDDGLPMPVSASDANGNIEQYILDHPIGNINPRLLVSVMPVLRWHNLTLSAMVDMRFGGDIVSVSEGMATGVGTSERTLQRGTYKEVNGLPDYYMVVTGVHADGTPNTTEVSAQAYYGAIGLYKSQKGYAELFVHSASYIKLKELSVGYSLPRRLLGKTPLTELRLSLVARNLCFLMKHTPGNPDGGYDTSMFSQALDFAAVPCTRTLGFTVNIGL